MVDVGPDACPSWGDFSRSRPDFGQRRMTGFGTNFEQHGLGRTTDLVCLRPMLARIRPAWAISTDPRRPGDHPCRNDDSPTEGTPSRRPAWRAVKSLEVRHESMLFLWSGAPLARASPPRTLLYSFLVPAWARPKVERSQVDRGVAHGWLNLQSGCPEPGVHCFGASSAKVGQIRGGFAGSVAAGR